MSRPGIHRALPGERVLWEGRPVWRALARDAFHIRLVALYLALMLIWRLADLRMSGAGPAEAARAVLPSLLMDLAVLAAFAGFAWAVARTTRYTVTTERCMIEFGIALRATVSLPWRRIAAGSITVAGDGAGSIPLTLKPGPGISALKLWPHVHVSGFRAEPTLRSVPDAERVGALVAQAARAASPVRVMAKAQPGDPGLVSAPAAGN